MAADILDSKRLKVGCVEVSASEGGMEEPSASPFVLSGRDNSHKQNLLTPQSLLLLRIDSSWTVFQSQMIPIIGCSVGNLLISVKWELD